MIFLLFRRPGASRLDTPSAEVLLGAVHETSTVFYPRVVIEFYHTMTSKSESNPTAIHFSIDGWLGILMASDITTTLNLPVVLANSAAYRQ